MLEAELVDMNNIDQLLDFTEKLVKDVTLNVYGKFKPDFLSSFSPVDKNKKAKDTVSTPAHPDLIRNLMNKKFVRITYSDAIEILNELLKGKLGKKMAKKKIEFGEDMNKEQEKMLVDYFEQTPVFVTHYPTMLKPFYMQQSEEMSGCVENFDLLAPFVGEIVGGSLREYRLDVLTEAMKRQNLDLDDYKCYLDSKKYGAMQMGGFGLGMERSCLNFI